MVFLRMTGFHLNAQSQSLLRILAEPAGGGVCFLYLN